MKKFILASFLMTMVPFVAFAQAPATSSPAATAPVPMVTSVNPGLLPGDFFYFLDNWGEAIRTFFTFNPEAKAKLHLEYANERAAEIKAVLADPNRKLSDVAEAKQNFDKQVADAAAIVKDEKAKGADVSALASELNDKLDSSHLELKSALIQHGDQASQAEAQLRAKIATLAPTDPQVAGLTQALDSVTKEKDQAVEDNNNLSSEISDEQAVFDEAMGPKVAAEKHLEQVVRLREMLGQTGDASGTPAELSTTTVQLMNQAQAALLRGDFEAAKNISEQAKNAMERSRETVRAENEVRTGDSQTSGTGEGERMMNNGTSTSVTGDKVETPEVPEKPEVPEGGSTNGQRESNN